MTLFDKNMAAALQRYPDFKFIAIEEDVPFTVNEDPVPNMTFSVQGQTVTVHDANPVMGAKKQVDAIVFKEQSILISFGLGLGYEVREIIKKLGAKSVLVIAEPSALSLKSAFEAVDMTDIITNQQVHFFLYDKKESALAELYKRITPSSYRDCAAFVIPAYIQLFNQKGMDLLYAIEEIRSGMSLSKDVLFKLGTLWHTNIFNNFKYHFDASLVTELYGSFKDIPAVIVSAGPSLEKNIALLKGNEDRCIIICVDTAIKTVLSNGILPHFIVTVDAKESIARIFESVDIDNIPLIYVPSSSVGALAAHHGEKLLTLHHDDYFESVLESMGKDTRCLDHGGSVACTAFSFAQETKCNPIILIGQDLAFTGLKSHAQSSGMSEDVAIKPHMYTVEDINGDRVYTASNLHSYLTWFEITIAEDKSEVRYIDATEGGAKIKGTEILTLAETIETYFKTTGTIAVVSDALSKAQTQKFSDAQKRFIKKSYHQSLKNLHRLKQEAKKAAEQFKKINEILQKPNPNQNAVRNMSNQVASIQNKFTRVKGETLILSLPLRQLITEVEQKARDIEFRNALEQNRFVAKIYWDYFEQVQVCIDQTIDLLTPALEKLA